MRSGATDHVGGGLLPELAPDARSPTSVLPSDVRQSRTEPVVTEPFVTSPELGLEDAVLLREPCQLRPRAESGLLDDVGLVRLDRAHAEEELVGDLLVGVARSDQADDV